MATPEQVMQAIRNADAAGDSASVRQLGAVLQQMQAATQRQARIDALKKSNPAEYDPDSPEYKARLDPTTGMSTTQKVLAGTGKAFADVGRGVGQLLRKAMPDKAADAIGLPTQADIDEAKRLDAPLMNTTAGKVGNVAGNVAIALPTVFVPGAQTVAGSAAMGAGMGFLQPVASDESRLNNTLVGGAMGAAAPIVARTVAAGYKGAKALVEPFTENGRTAIAGRTLQRFGVEAGDVAGTTSNPTLTGARQTLAEQITRPEAAAGAARLQDSVRSLDPEIAAKMTAREVENNAARVRTLRDLAGEGGARDAAEAARRAAAKDAYGKAFSPGAGSGYGASSVDDLVQASYALRGEKIPYGNTGKTVDLGELAAFAAENQGATFKEIKALPREFQKWFNVEGGPMSALSTGERGEVTKLLKLPALQDAAKVAKEIAANEGKTLGSAGSIEGMHYMKLALDDQIANLSNGTVSQVNRARGLQAARDRLVTFMERMSPEYQSARVGYAANSKPINQMDIADTLFRKGTSATSDLGGTPRLMPDKFVNLLKNEEATVKSATGRDLGKLSQVLEPDQFQKVMAVGQELDRAAAVGRAANGPGSATAQRMASQNVLRQLLGPTGLPESWAESTLLNTAMRPVQFAYSGVAEPKIQAVLADLLLNPAKAQAALQAAQKGTTKALPAEVQAALPYLTQALKASVPAAALTGQR